MNRRQRSTHLVLWALIAPVLIATIGLGVWARRHSGAASPGPDAAPLDSGLTPRADDVRHVP